MDLSNKTYFITGSSRGIGQAIALRLAKQGANIVITGKSDKPHPKLEGTVHSVAKEVEQAGGKALAIALDVRDEKQIQQAMDQAANHFGGIDALVNNASAINLTGIEETPMRRYDLMMQVNVRATYACSQAAIPYLKQSEFGHILTMSPPLDMRSRWFKDFLAYTMSKYGMSMCTLGLSESLKADNIAVNSLWPKTVILTAAIVYNFPEAFQKASRSPQIVADAAFEILTGRDIKRTGNFYVDEDVLRQAGVTDFDCYATDLSVPLVTDLFLEEV